MIVVDSSAVIELLLLFPRANAVAEVMESFGGLLCAPHLIDFEVLHTLRRYNLGQWATAKRAEQALSDLARLEIERYPHQSLMARTWELRHNLTAYDAAYVALAEVLDAPLITCDARLAAARGHKARIELIA